MLARKQGGRDGWQIKTQKSYQKRVCENQVLRRPFDGDIGSGFPNAAVGSFRDRVKGSEDYLIGAAIEALELADLFFDKE